MNRRGILKLVLSSPVLWLTPGPVTAEGPSAGHLFGSNAGMILNTIKPDHAADFEAVLRRLKAALQASAEPVRKTRQRGGRSSGPSSRPPTTTCSTSSG